MNYGFRIRPKLHGIIIVIIIIIIIKRILLDTCVLASLFNEQSRAQNAAKVVEVFNASQHTKTLLVNHNPKRLTLARPAKPHRQRHRPLKYRRFDRPQPQPADP